MSAFKGQITKDMMCISIIQLWEDVVIVEILMLGHLVDSVSIMEIRQKMQCYTSLKTSVMSLVMYSKA
jgi:hypothetical protein